MPTAILFASIFIFGLEVSTILCTFAPRLNGAGVLRKNGRFYGAGRPGHAYFFVGLRFPFFLQEPTLRLLAVDKIYLFKQILLPNLASVLFP